MLFRKGWIGKSNLLRVNPKLYENKMEKIKMTIIVDINRDFNYRKGEKFFNSEEFQKDLLTLQSSFLEDCIGEIISVENIEILK